MAVAYSIPRLTWNLNCVRVILRYNILIFDRRFVYTTMADRHDRLVMIALEYALLPQCYGSLMARKRCVINIPTIYSIA